MRELTRERLQRYAASAVLGLLRLLKQFLRYGSFLVLAWFYLPRDGVTLYAVLGFSFLYGSISDLTDDVRELKRIAERDRR